MTEQFFRDECNLDPVTIINLKIQEIGTGSGVYYVLRRARMHAQEVKWMDKAGMSQTLSEKENFFQGKFAVE